MPEGWSQSRDLAKLAEARAQFDLSIPLGDLPGIPAEFKAADGPVRSWLQFGRAQGQVVVQIRLASALKAVCQRCLGEMRLELGAESRLAIVKGEAQVSRVPEEFETFLAPDGHASLAALVAEELLLALPLVPRHGPGESCVVAPTAELKPAEASAAEETQRPFADLRSLLDRKSEE
jgi:DUF177 domain-containing protein